MNLAPRSHRGIHRVRHDIVYGEHLSTTDRTCICGSRKMATLVADRARATELAGYDKRLHCLRITCFESRGQAENGVPTTPRRVAHPTRNRRLPSGTNLLVQVGKLGSQ